MIIENKMNLPEAFVRAVTPKYHNEKGSYSATTLLKGTKEILLTERHWENISIDCSDMVNAILGTAFHSVMEENSDKKFTEVSVNTEVSGIKVTGKVDLYDEDNKTVYDWKTASVWKVIKGDFSDWRKQGLIYAYLLKLAGHEVNKCSFIVSLKDFSPTKSETDASYPRSAVYVYSFDVTDNELDEIKSFIESKIENIKMYLSSDDDSIVPCSSEERWAEPPKFAVMKSGRKTAVKLHDTKEDAEKYIADSKDNKSLYIEERKGCDKKCEKYCICNSFCSYYLSQVKGK